LPRSENPNEIMILAAFSIAVNVRILTGARIRTGVRILIEGRTNPDGL